MNIYFQILFLLSLFIKDNYSKYRNYIKEEFFEKELLPLLNTVDLYYKTNLNNLSTDDFNNLFFSEIKHNQEYYKNV